jgi:hypothetical protein
MNSIEHQHIVEESNPFPENTTMHSNDFSPAANPLLPVMDQETGSPFLTPGSSFVQSPDRTGSPFSSAAAATLSGLTSHFAR